MDNDRNAPLISLEELFGKEHRFVSSEDALKDVAPPAWRDEVLAGKERVIVGTNDEVL